MASVAIIGYGELGKALGKLLEQGGSAVHFWDKDVSKVPEQGGLRDAVSAADVIFMCVPSWALREAAKEISANIKKDTVVAGLSKGMEAETAKTADQVLEEILPAGQPRVLMSGPMIAEELIRGAYGAAVLAASDKAVCDAIAALFSGTPFSVEISSDVRGVALSGVLKNIYAIGAGIVDALDLGCNAKGWYLACALSEMAGITERLGGERETAFGSSGLADLIATGCSTNSRNHQTGVDIVKTGKCCLRGEGFVSVPSVQNMLGDSARSYPLFSALSRVIIGGEPARETFTQLFGKNG